MEVLMFHYFDLDSHIRFETYVFGYAIGGVFN